MYNSLTGEITEKRSDSLCLTLSGIEWLLECSKTTLTKLPPLGESARVFTYLQHREDGMKLFGFATEKERTLFLKLITVNGISTSGAKKILSNIKESELVSLLENEDVKGLNKIPGIGNKTAQKMILQLKGTLISLEEEGKNSPQNSHIPKEGEDLAEALVNMGFDRKQVLKEVTSLIKESPLETLSKEEREKEWLREGIIRLSR